MSKRLFVGGLAWGTTEETLREAFEGYGVVECKIICHRDGEHEGKSKGFGFVAVEQGDAALAEMDGFELEGRYLRVNEAHQQQRGGGRRNDNRDNRRDGNRRREGGRQHR
jgi:RNA recognition motif-containing protein